MSEEFRVEARAHPGDRWRQTLVTDVRREAEEEYADIEGELEEARLSSREVGEWAFIRKTDQNR